MAVGKNIAANYAGRLWAAALGIVVPPICARIVGFEAYGLVGVFSTIAAILNVLDLGLATSLQREIARTSVNDAAERARISRDLVRTFSVIFAAIGVVAGLVVIAAAPAIAERWVKVEALPRQEVLRTLQIIGLIIAVQWPTGVYLGALAGLQHQVAQNVVTTAAGTLRSLGAVAVLLLVSRSIVVYFAWQLAVASGQLIAARYVLSRHIGTGERHRMSLTPILAGWRFSLGMWSVSLVGMTITQLDKVIVSKALPLREFGYYTLATTVSNALFFLIGPVSSAVFPRLCQLREQNDQQELSRLYHLSCSIMAVVLIPVALTVALFSRELVFGWTGDWVTVAHTSTVISLLTLGTLANGLLNVPFALQLAYGWTRLAFSVNATSLLLSAPMLWFLVRNYGTAGAASGWLMMNAAALAVIVVLQHRRVLIGEFGRWLRSVVRPTIGVLLVLLPLRAVLHAPSSRPIAGAMLATAGLLAASAGLLASADVRILALTLLARRKEPRRA